MSTLGRIAILSLVLALSGCATTNNNPQDPFEGFNRAMFSFNDTFDQVALKPAAQAYRLLPSFIQTGIDNFFGNIGDVWTAVNNFLQGKPKEGFSDVNRVLVNSTFGLAGLLDIGSEAGLSKHKEDFGQTLGKWGVKSGPYVVLPFFGSSTVRDTVALPVDLKADLWQLTTPVDVRNTGTVVRFVDQRAAVLDASDLIEEAALDRYEFVRDAYLQRRESNVHDGESAPARSKSDDQGAAAGAKDNAASESLPSTSDNQGAAAQPSPAPSAPPQVESSAQLEESIGHADTSVQSSQQAQQPSL